MNALAEMISVGGPLLAATIVLVASLAIGRMFHGPMTQRRYEFPPPIGAYRSLVDQPPDMFDNLVETSFDTNRQYFFGDANPSWIFVPERTIAPVEIWRSSSRAEDFPAILCEQLRFNLECLAPGYRLIPGSIRYVKPRRHRHGFWEAYVEAKFCRSEPPKVDATQTGPVIDNKSPVGVAG